MKTPQGFVVKTVCRSVEDFVERYHGRVRERTLFVSVVEESVLGSPCAFVILLADRQPVLAGMCEVLEVYPNTDNRYGRRGMRIEIRLLGIASELVWTKLVARSEQIDAAVDAAINAATSQSRLMGTDDLMSIAIEFEEQTTMPIRPLALN